MEGDRKIHTYIQTDTIIAIFWPLLLGQRKIPDSRFLETTMINIHDINTYFMTKNDKLPESYMLSKPMFVELDHTMIQCTCADVFCI